MFLFQRISELEAQLEEVSKAEAVHQYKESHFRKREDSLQEEVGVLKQRLENANEGRDYEKDVFLAKVTALNKAEEVLKTSYLTRTLARFCIKTTLKFRLLKCSTFQELSSYFRFWCGR